MSVTGVRLATVRDVPRLVALMTEFYAEAGFPLPPGPAARAFSTLVTEPRFGRVWLLEDDHDTVGHVVLTLAYSMEYGGLRGFVDDLYVRRSYRGRGLAALALAAVRRACEDYGVRALHVEVGPENDVARRLYERAGFHDSRHLLLTLPLATPVHAEPGDAG